MKQLLKKFEVRIKQNPRNQTLLQELLERVAIRIKDPSGNIVYAKKL